MIEEPHVVQSIVREAAVIHVTCTRAEMPTVFGPTVQELLGEMKAQGAAPAGPMFAHFLTGPTEVFDFNIGFPVAAAVSASGRMMPADLPSARVVRTTYHGGYEGLSGAWSEVGDWMKAQGIKGGDGLWESYVIGPGSSSDPATWRTELNKPIAD